MTNEQLYLAIGIPILFNGIFTILYIRYLTKSKREEMRKFDELYDPSFENENAYGLSLIQYCHAYQHDIFVRRTNPNTGKFTNSQLSELTASELLDYLKRWEENQVEPSRIINVSFEKKDISEQNPFKEND